MSSFIFMLTHNDVTVQNAREVLDDVIACDLQYVGFKDVGATRAVLKDLAERAHDAGLEVMLEIVSTDLSDELRSLHAAIEIGVDWVLGGTNPDVGEDILGGAGIRYCPFPGTVHGHPSVLVGEPAEIVEHACQLAARAGVHGVDLLAYRHESADPLALARAVVEAVDGPVVVAGSIATLEQVEALRLTGAWGFTIGGAIFEGRLPGGPTVPGQVDGVLAAVREPAQM